MEPQQDMELAKLSELLAVGLISEPEFISRKSLICGPKSDELQPTISVASVEMQQNPAWWGCTEKTEGTSKWKTLKHNGVMFPPPYAPHGINLLYDGVEVALTPEQEEMATTFARYATSDHAKNPVFVANFWRDFNELLNPPGSTNPHVIRDLSKCDFSTLIEHVQQLQEARRNRSASDKQTEREEKERIQQQFGYAIMDGERCKVANFMVDPPGLFMGRGAHPCAGMWKKRVTPEDITLNLSEDATIPPAPKGHNWKRVVHDRTATWLASWSDSLLGVQKYVFLSPHAPINAKLAREKFEHARQVKGLLASLREDYECNLINESIDLKERQLSLAMLLIDRAGMLVGNEKESAGEGVECLRLKPQHFIFNEPGSFTLDFLGADSIRFKKMIFVPLPIYEAIKQLVEYTKLDNVVLDTLAVSTISAKLHTVHPQLSPKILRISNSSTALANALATVQPKQLCKLPLDQRMEHYNSAVTSASISMGQSPTAALGEVKLEIGVAKYNYMDPRITIQWSRDAEVPIEKLFSKILRDKYQWAITEVEKSTARFEF